MNPSLRSRDNRRSPQPSRREGFTSIEIMIVVAVVGVLSLLAVAGIHRIRDRAICSAIQNNLRQIFQAKEQYFSESGTGNLGSLVTLKNSGHLRPSIVERLMSGHSL